MTDGNEKLYKFKERSDAAAEVNNLPSLTVQSDAIDADINVIVRRFNITGQMPQGLVIPEYGDYDGVFDYQTALNAVRDADRQFMSLPAEIRKEFDNDAGIFLREVSDPANIDRMVELGLAVKKPVEELPAPPAPAPAPPP